MRRLLLCLAVLGAAGSIALAAPPLYVTPDVPTFESLNGTTLLPWVIYRYDGLAYTPQLAVPGTPHIDAIHKLDTPGDWLFSVEAASDLGGALQPPGTTALPGDVIHFDSSAGSYTICFSAVAAGLAGGTNVDAVSMEGGDEGVLLVSFDVPTDLAPFVFEPADLARFRPTGPGICPGWALTAANPAFDASAAGSGIALSSDVRGAFRRGTNFVLSLDVPTDLGPPGVTIYVPGQIVSTDGLTFSLYETLGWPISSIVDGLSSLASPGSVPPNLLIGRATVPATDIVLYWSPSCSGGSEDYGIYEGQIGSWYSHTRIDCNDAGADLKEQVTPAVASSYYLVVAKNPAGEGSYGHCSSGVCLPADERPVGAARCVTPQNLDPCPP